MLVIWHLEPNYNCEKNENKLQPTTAKKNNSVFAFDCGVSTKMVIAKANGTNVNSKMSLLLFGENTKTNSPIKNAAMIFLYVE